MIGEEMDRRTFVKMAASTPLLSAVTPTEASPDHGRSRWPETAYLDNPIANGLIPMKFVEELPLSLRGYAWTSPYEEIFRFVAHEWITDAVLFRGMEIKPKNPSDFVNQEILDSKLYVYIDDYKASDGCRLGTFMGEGGRAFPLRDIDSTACLYSAMRGWADKDGDGWSDMRRYLGYFLPNKSSLSVKIENSYKGSISVEIKCDMARYTAKK